MPGERWEDKRARAVLFAGANRIARSAQADRDPDGGAPEEPGALSERPDATEGADGPGPTHPDQVADTGLAVRELLFVDAEVREENADPKAHRIGYSRDCMQYATLEPAPEGLLVGLWVGPEAAPQVKAELGARDDPNPFRRVFGWVRVPVPPTGVPDGLRAWVAHAVRHAAGEKARQAQDAAAKRNTQTAR